MAKSKKAQNKRQSVKHSEIAEWEARLRECGLPSLKRNFQPTFIPRRRRAKPLLDEDGDELELQAALNLDGSPLVNPYGTERLPRVTKGAFLKLADYFKFSGVERTVLGMRLLYDFAREGVRGYYLSERPEQVSEAMSAWRKFSQRMPEIRAFLAGYRQDREVPAKPKYRLLD